MSLSDDPLQTAAQYPGVMEAGDTVGAHSDYSEGLLVGYRWYDAKGITPLFPFGYGLSYTSFRCSGIAVTRTSSGAQVTFTVTNTGERAGADVPQVYIGDPAAVGEPPKQLKGFVRVVLVPGQSKTLTIPLDAMSFAYWNTQSRAWMVSAGTYQVMVGSSSSDIAGQGSVALPNLKLGVGRAHEVGHPGLGDGLDHVGGHGDLLGAWELMSSRQPGPPELIGAPRNHPRRYLATATGSDTAMIASAQIPARTMK